MERPDALVVDVDEFEVVELLQDHVAGVVKNVRAGMIVDRGKEALEGHAVVKVFAGVQLETGIDSVFVEGIEDWEPSASELGEGFFDEAGGALRPGIEERPGKGSGEGGVSGEAKVSAG